MQRLSNGDRTRLAKKLASLLNDDPRAALAEARQVPMSDIGGGLTTEFLTASILVDGGIALKDGDAIREGRTIFERLEEGGSENPSVLYNLANALLAEADLVEYDGPSWFLQTRDLRVHARKNLRIVSQTETTDDLRARAATNLGNALRKCHRWIEAYDTYIQALKLDPTNAVARVYAAKIALQAIDLGLGDPAVLKAVASKHIHRAARDRKRLEQLIGSDAAQSLVPLLESTISGGEYPDLSGASDYQVFVAEHRLALSPTIEGLEPASTCWDPLHIKSIIEPTGTTGVPPVFAIFNMAKSEYLAARWLSYLALHSQVPRSTVFSDTLDYAKYGPKISLLLLSQRAGLDVLDKIAMFICEYFGLRENPRKVGFRTKWHMKSRDSGEIEWHPSVRPEIELGNPALIALSEIALDLGPGGFLRDKKQLRDISTHRVAVVHDEGKRASRDSRYVVHYNETDFVETLFQTLQMARASLVYLVEAVTVSEARKREKAGKLGELIVPDHHWVRGNND